MKNTFNLKKLVPYIAGITIFFITTLIYFGPLWQNKQVNQHDLKTFKGMSKEIMDFKKDNNGEVTLWTNSMFGGMPAYLIVMPKKENVLRYVDKFIFRLNMPRPADYVFLYMVGFFILLLILGVDPWLSIIGAMAFAFSSYFFIILEAGHNTKAHAIAYMAPTLAFIIYTFKTRKYIVGGILFSFFMSLELTANHPQITYYLMLIVLAYGAGELIFALRNKEMKHFGKSVGILFAGLIIAITVNTSTYWSTLEHSPYTIRGKSELSFDKNIKSGGLDKDYATQWSYGIDETLTLLIPNTKGGASVALQDYAPDALKIADPQFKQNLKGMPSYWGSQPSTSGPVYVGAIIVFLFILGLFIVKGRFKIALAVVTVICIFLSWGHNFMFFTDLFFDYFPGYNKFRAVSMILVNVQLIFALLAFLTLNKILQRPEILIEKSKAFYISLSLTAGLSLLFYLMPNTFFDFLSARDQNQLIDLKNQYPQQASIYQMLFDNLESIRVSIFKSDSIRSFFFIIIAAGLLLIYSRKKFNKAILYVGLGALILLDLVSVDSRFLNERHYERKTKAGIPYKATAANIQILQDREPNYRVFNTTLSAFNDASTSYYHKSIGGYHGAKLRRYQDVIEHHLATGNMEVLNMLNTKYFIVGGQNNAPMPQMNPMRLGNAWFVNNIKWVNNPDQEIIHLGKVLELKAISDISNLEIYGRKLETIDTILATTPLIFNLNEENSKSINLGRLPMLPGIKYIIGNDPLNMDSNFIDVSRVPGGTLLSNRQFEARIIHNFNPAETAIIDKRFKSYFESRNFSYSPNASIKIDSYKPNHLTYSTRADSDQLAIFSEIYYDKGWEVYIDGKKADYFRANYILRGMVIPAGEHIVEFKFKPKSYYVGRYITLFSSLFLVISVLALIVFKVIKQVKAKQS